MTTVRLLGLVLAAVALFGCATTKDGMQGGAGGFVTNMDCPDPPVTDIPGHCGLGNCPIQVQVSTNPSDGKCEVLVGVSTVRIDRGNKPDIIWLLPQQSNWEFRAESGPYTLPINFKDQTDPDLKTQIGPAYVYSNGAKVRVSDANGKPNQSFAYKIRVYKRNGNDAPLESKDPVIFNEGP